MKQILITGASGFSGIPLCRELANSHQVYALARTSKHHGLKHPNIKLIQADLKNSSDLETKLPSKIDIVIHLAQSREYRNFPSEVNDIFSINIESTLKLLDWSRNHSVEKFIFTSTGNVYEPSKEALNETHLCLPNSFYGVSKYCAELMCNTYSPYFSVLNLRIFGIYGPHQKGMLIPNIYQMMKEKKEISLAKGIGIKLSPIYIDDFINITKHFLFDIDLPKSETINLCGNEIIGLNQIIELLEKYSGFKALSKTTDSAFASLIGDNQKLNAYINYNYLPISEGIKNFIKSETSSESESINY